MNPDQMNAARRCAEVLRHAADTAPHRQAGLWTVGLGLTRDPSTGERLPTSHPKTGAYAQNLMTLLFPAPANNAYGDLHMQHMRIIAAAGEAYVAVLVAPVLTVERQPSSSSSGDLPIRQMLQAVSEGEYRRALALRLETADVRELQYRFFRVDQGRFDIDPEWTAPLPFRQHEMSKTTSVLVDRAQLGNPTEAGLRAAARAILALYATKGWCIGGPSDKVPPIICIEEGN